MKITIIIRNDSPMIYCGDSPSYRTVVVELTPEQAAKVVLAETHREQGVRFYEQISRVILEAKDQTVGV